MKKFLVLLVVCFLCVSCKLAKDEVSLEKNSNKVSVLSYEDALLKVDRTCKTDEDCVAVNKGCCECQGKDVVNINAKEEILPLWKNQCANVACTLQMCYVDLDVFCQDGYCKGSPKKHEEYFTK